MYLKISFLFMLLMNVVAANGQNMDMIYLWPGNVPGENGPKSEMKYSDDKSRGVSRIAEVNNPGMVVFEPNDANRNGAAIVICPGGAYNILAVDLEGYEVAKWLSDLGYTAFVLHYRVPRKKEGALQDAQRAMRMVRANADKYNIKADKIGIMGFSAGGSLSARASTLFSKETYTPIDKIDVVSARPDFALLIYPAYLDEGENRSLTPELTITAQTPPMFMFETADDPYGNSSLVMAGALRDNKIPVEMHFLSTGGHGYGLRKGNIAGETWPALAEKWLTGIIRK